MCLKLCSQGRHSSVFFISVALHWILSSVFMSILCQGAQNWITVLQLQPHWHWVYHLPLYPVSISPTAHQNATGHKDTLLTCALLGVQQDSKDLFCNAAFQLVSLQFV